MAHILITGSSGFVGSHTLAVWPEGDVLIPVTRADADLRDASAFVELLERRRPDVVVHLAWVASSTHSYRDDPANADLARAALAAARWCLRHDVRFLATGSVLDDGPGTDAYSAAKRDLRQRLALELETEAATWLRPYYVFDPVEGHPAVLRAALDARGDDRSVDLARPMARHDFIHVDDVARAVVTSVHHDLRGVVEIGSGHLHTVSELVEGSGARWRPSSGAVANVHSEMAADVKLLLQTGWKPYDTERYFHA